MNQCMKKWTHRMIHVSIEKYWREILPFSSLYLHLYKQLLFTQARNLDIVLESSLTSLIQSPNKKPSPAVLVLWAAITE